MSEQRVRLGWCSVDSGTLMVVDPCYISDNGLRAGLTHDEWSRPLDAEYTRAYTEPEYLAHVGVRDGVVFTTQIGDGVYPVEAVIDERGMLLRVEVLIGQAGQHPAATFDPDPDLAPPASLADIIALYREIFGEDDE